MSRVDVQGVFIGKAKDLGGGLRSAIDKERVTKRLWLWEQGLGGDEHGDPRYHGGPERALHHYPAEHYRYWRKHYRQWSWKAPAFGENISTYGLTEDQVCIGDIFRWGQAFLQVSQPRSPCYRLNNRWGIPELAQYAQESGRCGWFYRVLRPGYVSPTDPLELIQRSYPALSVAQAIQHFFHYPLERPGLQTLIDCEALSERWRELAAQRLETGVVEDWEPRLLGLPLEGMQEQQESLPA
ncbi:MOSC domain-containing protein [Zestomonas thermotolerans]|uniref:MOSC domain-containing protein n=1 Tax=Zestomonas thermotolerans TaxID=157784 RepID=UPI0003A42567|nr:MOSC domain-containing protein [Pseudomonas thermotolerans]MBO2510651.1 MOSC domain-containing protein [Gammaproteobacteria bacterium]